MLLVGTNEAERDSQIRFTSERHSVCEGKYTGNIEQRSGLVLGGLPKRGLQLKDLQLDLLDLL